MGFIQSNRLHGLSLASNAKGIKEGLSKDPDEGQVFDFARAAFEFRG
jgi:hypothetical protein